MGNGCEKPVESCISFGQAAERSLRQNRGRAITQQEAMEIIHRADKANLVLQTSNARKPLFICTCCGCCCSVLRSLQNDSRPANRVSSPFVVSLNTDSCIGDGICVERCQMGALHIEHGKAILDVNRCIGCGLCITTCPAGSLELHRKHDTDQSYVPGTLLETYVRLGRVSGRMGFASLINLKFRSVLDRIRTV